MFCDDADGLVGSAETRAVDAMLRRGWFCWFNSRRWVRLKQVGGSM